MLPELEAGGALPPGRYRANHEQLHARFVAGQGPARGLLWRDWIAATNLLGRYVHVNAAWLYGPFLSETSELDTVHCLYWAEDLELDKARLEHAATKVVGAFAMPGQVRHLLGLKVHTHLAAWHCQPDLKASDGRYAQYTQDRGALDDLFQRINATTPEAGSVRGDAWPQRGYVEVIIGDYT